MNKISINLNPQKEDTSNETVQNLTFYTPLVGLCAAILLVLIVLLQMLVLKKTSTYKTYAKKWEEWEPKSKEISIIRSEIANLEKEKIKQQNAFTPEYEIAVILGDLFSSLSKNIWFESLYFKKGAMSMKGYVIKWQEDSLVSLEKFINSLRQREYFPSKFSKINMKKSNKKDFNGVKVLEFIIECKN